MSKSIVLNNEEFQLIRRALEAYRVNLPSEPPFLDHEKTVYTEFDLTLEPVVVTVVTKDVADFVEPVAEVVDMIEPEEPIV